MDLHVKFNAIIQEAIAQADQLDCSPETYIDMLQGWQEEIQVAIQAMRETVGDIE